MHRLLLLNVCVVGALSLLGACVSARSACGSQPVMAAAFASPKVPEGAGADAVADYADTRYSVEQLVCHANRGDRYAAYTLGRSFERAGDVDSAVSAYMKAVLARTSRTQVYSPPVGNERTGQVISIPGRAGPALPEAIAALVRLRGNAAE